MHKEGIRPLTPLLNCVRRQQLVNCREVLAPNYDFHCQTIYFKVSFVFVFCHQVEQNFFPCLKEVDRPSVWWVQSSPGSRFWSFLSSQAVRVQRNFNMQNLYSGFWTVQSWIGVTFRNLPNLWANLNSERFYNCTCRSRCVPVCVTAPTQK